MITATEARIRSSAHKRNQLDTIERHIATATMTGYNDRSISSYEIIGGALDSDVSWFLGDLGYQVTEDVDHLYISW